MSNRELFWVRATVFAALLLMPLPHAWCAEIDPPSRIAEQVAQLRKLRSASGKNGDAVVALSDVIGEAIYRWTADALRGRSVESVVAELDRSLRVIPRDGAMSGEGREYFTYRSEYDVVVSVSTWRRGDREVLVMVVDQLSADPHRGEREQYLVSRPPVLLAKRGVEVVVGDLQTVTDPPGYRFRQGSPWSVYEFAAFVEPAGDDAWPDVLVYRGPEGQGGYMSPVQTHLDTSGKREWQLVWESEGYARGSLTFDPKTQILNACWSDRTIDVDEPGLTGCEKLHISGGAAPGSRQLVKRALGPIPERGR